MAQNMDKMTSCFVLAVDLFIAKTSESKDKTPETYASGV